MEFSTIKLAISNKFSALSQGNLYVSKATKEELWDTYLSSYRPEDNPMFREKTEHDCNCCKSFIRSAGGILAIVDGELQSIWDVTDLPEGYQIVADAMSALVKSKGIDTLFLHELDTVGTDRSYDLVRSETWDHFFLRLPSQFVNRDGGGRRGETRDHYNMLRRSIQEISIDSINLVLDLITQNSIYRGTEHLIAINKMVVMKRAYEAATNKETFLWETSRKMGGHSGYRTSVIGTLLVDLTEGRDLGEAVKAFEFKVAPHNYKRPTALITQTMITNAEEKVTSLGLEDSLARRMAVPEDVTIDNVLFADRSAKAKMGIFDSIKKEVKVDIPKYDQVQEVDIDTFLRDILPKATSIELAMSNSHVGNLMTMVAPVNPEAEPILRWGNNFSWSYNGEVADSVKERVKAAGGNVEGDVRISLSWYNPDDLDLHVLTPRGEKIKFSYPRSRCGGRLDVDMNANGKSSATAPVENITWADETGMAEGDYLVVVNNYTHRSSQGIGFEVEIEYNGVIRNFVYDNEVGQGEFITVVKFEYTSANGISIINSLPTTESTKEVWGIQTSKFHKVNMIMNSPNHWDGRCAGNSHTFFILDECINPDPVRGFYNEFLRDDLHEHRKVFEVLGSKMRPPVSNNQLSGLGFSSTQTNEVLCKVVGSFNRIIKIKF